MRCKNCPYKEYDYSEETTLCAIFGYGDDEISEDRHGDEGCRYNQKTLEKFIRRHREVDEPEIVRQMGDFAKWCEEHPNPPYDDPEPSQEDAI